MPNDLVSREAVLKALRARGRELLKLGTSFESNIASVTALECVNIVKDVPAVDAVPVVHGRWAPNIREDTRAYPPYTYQNGFKCSVCGRVTRSKKEPYCHCGAKMDGKVDSDRGEKHCIVDGTTITITNEPFVIEGGFVVDVGKKEHNATEK